MGLEPTGLLHLTRFPVLYVVRTLGNSNGMYDIMKTAQSQGKSGFAPFLFVCATEKRPQCEGYTDL